MPKAIGFIGNPQSLPVGSRDNTGNIVHGHAARSMFEKPIAVTSSPDPENITSTRDRCSHIGFVAATMLHVNRVPRYIDGHARAAKFIESLELPIVTFGFGCQAPLGQSLADSNVDDRSIRLLRVVSDHSEKIAVRGSFTADLCFKYGVRNVEVVGCQSCYVAGLENHANFPTTPPAADRCVGHLSLSPDESEVLKLMMASGVDMIGQGDPLEEKISTGELSRDKFISQDHKFWISPLVRNAIGKGALDAGEYYDYIRNRFFKFYDVSAWKQHLSRYSFSFGTRFHGNMIAFHAGVPALWFVHDMRTEELCQHFSLPHIYHEKISGSTALSDLSGQADYSEFRRAFPGNLSRFMSYLEKNGVTDLVKPDFLRKTATVQGSAV